MSGASDAFGYDVGLSRVMTFDTILVSYRREQGNTCAVQAGYKRVNQGDILENAFHVFGASGARREPADFPALSFAVPYLLAVKNFAKAYSRPTPSHTPVTRFPFAHRLLSGFLFCAISPFFN